MKVPGTYNILMVGVGGQGIIMASDIICLAAMYSGNDAKKSEIHGMSQRGGSVFSHIRFGDRVFSPVIPAGKVDILISFEEMETIRWLNYLKPDGKIIICRNRVKPSGIDIYPDDLITGIKSYYKNIIVLNPAEILEQIENYKFLNVFILGFLSSFLGFKESIWKKAIEKKVPYKTVEKNWESFLAGVQHSNGRNSNNS